MLDFIIPSLIKCHSLSTRVSFTARSVSPVMNYWCESRYNFFITIIQLAGEFFTDEQRNCYTCISTCMYKWTNRKSQISSVFLSTSKRLLGFLNIAILLVYLARLWAQQKRQIMWMHICDIATVYTIMIIIMTASCQYK